MKRAPGSEAWCQRSCQPLRRVLFDVRVYSYRLRSEASVAVRGRDRWRRVSFMLSGRRSLSASRGNLSSVSPKPGRCRNRMQKSRPGHSGLLHNWFDRVLHVRPMHMSSFAHACAVDGHVFVGAQCVVGAFSPCLGLAISGGQWPICVGRRDSASAMSPADAGFTGRR